MALRVACILGEEGMALGDVNGDGDCRPGPAPDIGRRTQAQRQRAILPGGKATRFAFSPAFKALVVDLDQDGNADILTSSSEHTADVAWFQAVDGPAGRWIRHVIQPAVAGAHTLQAADMDGDGDVDVVVGQMPRPRNVPCPSTSMWMAGECAGHDR